MKKNFAQINLLKSFLISFILLIWNGSLQAEEIVCKKIMCGVEYGSIVVPKIFRTVTETKHCTPLKVECPVEVSDHSHNRGKLFLNLIKSSKYMRIILSCSTHPREPVKFTSLLVAVYHGIFHITNWEITVASRTARIDLGMMWTVHRLHHELVV